MAVVYASARDRLGQTLGGTYLLEDVLGVGGTAVVYRARKPDGSVVALKMLHDYLCSSEEVCRRFKREAYVANIVEHPGTVRVLDDGTADDGVAYLVLELLDGESVEERRLRFGGQLPLEEVLTIAEQLLTVLEIAHAKDVVHRDIKPSNLFVDEALRLKVLDFGIARIVTDTSSTSTKTGQMVGTPAFMPPEQALSRPRDVDARTDLWAVGATMFTLLSGQHVHHAESSSEHLVKAATLHARSLAKALPGVPANVEALVARALSFAKDDRWPDARAMREALAEVRLDPGRRLGTSTTPPPPRRTDSNMPTRVGDYHGERISDASSLAVEKNPGFSPQPTRGVVLAVVVAAAVLAGGLGFFAARSTTKASASPTPLAAAASPARAGAQADVPPVSAPLPPAPMASAVPSASAPAASSARPAPPLGPSKAAASARAPSAGAPASRPVRPTQKSPSSASTVDVYRPF